MNQCIRFISFCNDTLHVSDGLSVHHQESKTAHTAVCLLARRQQYLFDKCLLLMCSLGLLMVDGKTVRNTYCVNKIK